MSTHDIQVHTNLLCDCCCTTAVRTRSTHTTHMRIHHDQTCIAVIHTRIAVLSVAVSSSKKSKKPKKLKCGVPAHRPARTYTHAHTYHSTHRTKTDATYLVTAYAEGNMEHGLLHASHSSCWCFCCGSALLLAVEAEVLLLLLLLCPSKAWSSGGKTGIYLVSC